MSQYPWLLLAVYVFTVGGVQLLALWAATSRRPWLLRALAVWAPIALLAIARVYEPALVLLTSAALTIGLSFAVQRIGLPRDRTSHAWPRLWRFHLADLLVLMLFLATWLGITKSMMVVEYQLQLLLPVTLAATPLALLTLFVHRSVTGPMRRRATLLALSVIWICALLLRTFNMRLYLGEGQPSLGPNWPSEMAFTIGLIGAMIAGVVLCAALPFGVWKATKNWGANLHRRAILVATGVALACGLPLGYLAWEFLPGSKWKTAWQWCQELGIHSVFFFALAGFIALGTWLAQTGWGTAAGWKRLGARATAISLGALAAIPASWIYWQMLWYAPYPKVDYGPVNHYDRIVAIAKLMNEYDNSQNPLPKQAASELNEAVILLQAANHIPQHVLEAGVRRPYPETGLTGHHMMALCGRLREAADNAANKRKLDRAADYAIAIVRFDAMAGGGDTANFGYAGYQFLVERRSVLSSAKAREIIDLLHRTLAERDDAEVIAARSLAQWERQSGWNKKLQSALARFRRKKVFDSSAEAGRIREARKPWEMQNRLLQADLAIRVHQNEHDRLPLSLQELVPDVLPELPIDPYSGKPLIYRPDGEKFILYSVGPDGEDNGGKFLSQPVRSVETEYDIRLE